MFSKKVLMFCLFYASCSAVVGGGYWSYQRVHHAAQRVAARHLIGDPPTAVQRMKELASESIKGGPGVRTSTGAFAGIPMSPAAGERVSAWDPGTVAELKREGIDVADLNEVRMALRETLAEPDSQVRLKKAKALQAKFGIIAGPALLGRLDRIDGQGRPLGAFTEGGSGFLAGMGESLARLYRGLLKEVDR